MIRMHAPGQNADPSSIQIQYTKQAIQDQWLNMFTDNWPISEHFATSWGENFFLKIQVLATTVY